MDISGRCANPLWSGYQTILVDWNGLTSSGSICVSALNECGSSPSDCMEVIVDMTDGSNEINNKTYSVFPNPANETLTVSFDDGLDYEIVLLDILGIVVLPPTSYVRQSEIALSKFAVGTYWLKLSRQGQVFWERVEIVR